MTGPPTSEEGQPAAAIDAMNELPQADRVKAVQDVIRTLPPTLKREVAREALSLSESDGKVVVAITFSASAFSTVEALVQNSGRDRSLSTVLMDALALEKLYQDTVAAKQRFLLEVDKGDFREVTRREG